jgi:hypothetical protein
VVEVKQQTLCLADLSIHFQQDSVTTTALGYGWHILEEDAVSVAAADLKNPPPKKKWHVVSEKHQSQMASAVALPLYYECDAFAGKICLRMFHSQKDSFV